MYDEARDGVHVELAAMARLEQRRLMVLGRHGARYENDATFLHEMLMLELCVAKARCDQRPETPRCSAGAGVQGAEGAVGDRGRLELVKKHMRGAKEHARHPESTAVEFKAKLQRFLAEPARGYEGSCLRAAVLLPSVLCALSHAQPTDDPCAVQLYRVGSACSSGTSCASSSA